MQGSYTRMSLSQGPTRVSDSGSWPFGADACEDWISRTLTIDSNQLESHILMHDLLVQAALKNSYPRMSITEAQVGTSDSTRTPEFCVKKVASSGVRAIASVTAALLAAVASLFVSLR